MLLSVPLRGPGLAGNSRQGLAPMAAALRVWNQRLGAGGSAGAAAFPAPCPCDPALLRAARAPGGWIRKGPSPPVPVQHSRDWSERLAGYTLRSWARASGEQDGPRTAPACPPPHELLGAGSGSYWQCPGPGAWQRGGPRLARARGEPKAGLGEPHNAGRGGGVPVGPQRAETPVKTGRASSSPAARKTTPG